MSHAHMHACCMYTLCVQLVAVLLAVGGITLFAYEDGFKSSDKQCSAIGVALSVGSAIGAALYKVDILCTAC